MSKNCKYVPFHKKFNRFEKSIIDINSKEIIRIDVERTSRV